MIMSVKLKVVSLNLWIGGLLFDGILEFLKEENPDIVLLQEVYNGQNPALKSQFRSFSVLQEKLGFKHSHFAPTFLETIGDFAVEAVHTDDEPTALGFKQKIEQGNAIFSKFPIEAKETKFYDFPFGDRIDKFEYYSVTPRNLQHVIIDLGFQSATAQKLHVMNTQGIWGTHGDDTDRRLKMSKLIVEEVSGNTPLIFAGDLNLNPNTESVRNIEKVLESVFKSNLKTSFNLRRKNLEKDPGYATSAVDMMFVSKDIKVLENSCPNVDISDHLPLIAQIEI